MNKNKNQLSLFIFDLIIIYSYFLFVYIAFKGWSTVPLKAIFLMPFAALLWVFITLNTGIANIHAQSELHDVLIRILAAYSVFSACAIAVVAFWGDFWHNDKLLLYPLYFAFLTSILVRVFYLVLITYFVKHGYWHKNILIIGHGRLAEKVINEISQAKTEGYALKGILAENYYETLHQELYLGKPDCLSEMIRILQINEVIIAMPFNMEKEIAALVAKCENESVRVRIAPDFFRLLRTRSFMDRLGTLPLIAIRPEPLNLLRNRFIKRSFDIFFSLTILILSAPLFIFLAIAIKRTSRGPIIFKQKRVGINNKEFIMFKFRSMVVQDVKESDTDWIPANDDHITSIGKVMRRYGLDELPQFINVLMGDMSVAGPRPERPYFVEKFSKEIGEYQVRHFIKAGITGLAQVNGLRGDTSIKKRIEYDIFYLENWSLRFDLKIIWQTVFGKKYKNITKEHRAMQ